MIYFATVCWLIETIIKEGKNEKRRSSRHDYKTKIGYLAGIDSRICIEDTRTKVKNSWLSSIQDDRYKDICKIGVSL